ncbi:arginine deiminase-related protein, partial [Serratia marcescens]|uniref:arginine deiminase-related protein n=1 Tax=Serratia marcescens TaxID=615 RepID=UPI001EF94882
MALIGLSTLGNAARRAEIRDRLEASGRAVIDLSHGQIADFAGNAMELQGRGGPLLALSSRAFGALD